VRRPRLGLLDSRDEEEHEDEDEDEDDDDDDDDPSFPAFQNSLASRFTGGISMMPR
jgi:hypothetical protein